MQVQATTTLTKNQNLFGVFWGWGRQGKVGGFRLIFNDF